MSASINKQELAVHGWVAVPRPQAKVIAELNNPKPAKFVVDDIKLPESSVAKETYAYAKKELSTETFNHSMRVY